MGQITKSFHSSTRQCYVTSIRQALASGCQANAPWLVFPRAQLSIAWECFLFWRWAVGNNALFGMLLTADARWAV